MTFILIGQKNVGKSSIFNRLLKKNNIVHSKEGSTRDFIPGSLIKDNKIIELIDTPGINPISKNKYDKE
ncbi:MAG: GTPase Der, partial [Alphaproteobacteria bacterium MarineAlpha5_Bin11]